MLSINVETQIQRVQDDNNKNNSQGIKCSLQKFKAFWIFWVLALNALDFLSPSCVVLRGAS